MMKILTLLLALCASVPALAQVISPALAQFNTWTPGVTTDGTDPTGAIYVTQTGSYVITGSLVVTWFEITVTAWPGTPTGNVVLNGLPVANNALDNGYCSLPSAIQVGLNGIFSYIVIAPSATGVYFYEGVNEATIPVSGVETAIINKGSWVVNGICWYHF
jgi:hypothetical protein